MKRQQVSSSHIASVGYENGVLEVEFLSGQIYRGECPEEYYTGLISAESVGRYFNEIKNAITLTRVQTNEASG